MVGVGCLPGTANSGNGAGAAGPAAGTPAYNIFDAQVVWTPGVWQVGGSGGTPAYGGGAVLTFTNLDPAKRYIFKGTAQPRKYRFIGAVLESVVAGYDRGGWQHACPGASAGNIGGASCGHAGNRDQRLKSVRGQHAARTSRRRSRVDNNTAGDVIGWSNIVPSAAGSFSIIVTNWRCFATTAPYYNGSTWTSLNLNDNYSYAFSAFMLVEVEPEATVLTLNLSAPGQRLDGLF